jgi:hypothetical protein
MAFAFSNQRSLLDSRSKPEATVSYSMEPSDVYGLGVGYVRISGGVTIVSQTQRQWMPWASRYSE